VTFAPELAELGPDRWTLPFWEAAREGRLVAPVCPRCDRGRMPPTSHCPHCGASDAPDWEPTSGQARVFSYTVAHQAFHPALGEHVPYVLAIVALVDRPDVRLATNLLEVDTEAVQIDDLVEVVFDRVDDDTVIPRFRPANGGSTQPGG